MLGKRQRQVYALLVEAGRNGFAMSDREIGQALHWPINCVTPRRSELVGAGLVCCGGVKWDAVTRRRVAVWRARLAEAET